MDRPARAGDGQDQDSVTRSGLGATTVQDLPRYVGPAGRPGPRRAPIAANGAPNAGPFAAFGARVGAGRSRGVSDAAIGAPTV